MKLRIGDDEYKITFRYDVSFTRGRATSCFILKNGIPIAVGDAVCSPKDTFCFETGRKLALSRAIQPYPKEQRALFWNTYLSRRTPADRANAATSGPSKDSPGERLPKSESGKRV